MASGHQQFPIFHPLQIKRQLTKLGIVSGRAKEKGLTAEQVRRDWKD